MRKTVAVALGLVVIVGAALTGLTQHLFFAHADTLSSSVAGAQANAQVVQGVALAGPAAPQNLTVHNDDHVATVGWQASSDSATVGYKVTWGPNGSLAHSFFTPYTQAQIQPLADGQTYQVQVQAVNNSGGLSAALGPATAQTDPTFVNQLRQNMNGMFDDFNSNPYQGQVDPTHWYTSYNNASPISMPFVFDEQHHLHMFLQNGGPYPNSDRGSMTMRALRPFDFANRTGTVAFDFDWGNGGTGRYGWYLTLSPTEVDDVNYDSVLGGGNHGIYPVDGFQIAIENRDHVSFRKFQGGSIVQVWDSVPDSSLREINVRRHSVLTISQNSATLTIDGHTLLDATGINLGFSRAWVYNQQFQYNLPKDHVPYALSHWDNIGFDAPAGYAPDVLHEYSDGSSVNSDRTSVPASWTINIPDDLSGASAERLFTDAWGIQEGQTSTVSVNGVTASWPSIPVTNDNVAFDTRVVNLPLGTLHRGANVVTIGGAGFLAQNIHVEVAFPAGSAAPYTPTPWPMASMGSSMQAMIPPIGPRPSFGDKGPADGATVSGSIPVEVQADGAYALLPTGHVDAVTSLSVDIDGKPVTVYALQAPTVSTDQVLNLDTTRLSNGTHTLTLTAYGTDKNADGSPVSLNTDAQILHNHDVVASSIRTITVNNQGGAPSSAPPQVSAPADTATPSSPLPINGVTCTVTIDGVQRTGVCSGQFAPAP